MAAPELVRNYDARSERGMTSVATLDLKGHDFSRAVRFWVGRGFSRAVRLPSLLVAFSPRPLPTHQMPSLHILRKLMPS